jgi:replicative DNA helicase
LERLEATLKWLDISEICTGFIILDKLDPHAVNPLDIHPNYSAIITMKREGATKADLIAKLSFNDIDTCQHAAERANGDLQPMHYLGILEQIASKTRAAFDLGKAIKRLENGEDVDVADLMKIAGSMNNGYRDLTPMSDVEPTIMKFSKTGYAPLDKHVGGIPPSCVTIIGASPGIGKTTLGLKIVKTMIKLPVNKKKYAAIFSLEMTMGQIHQRFIELSRDLSKEDKSRILLGDSAYNIHELYAIATKAAARHNLCVILIDFADLLVEGEQSESIMGVIYRSLSVLAKKTGIPVILIAQLNRATYDGGLPKIHHLRYSGLAEATARLILLLYNPTTVMVQQDKGKIPLPILDGFAYILVGKSNFGYKEGAPGGIMVPFTGELGWGDESNGYYKLGAI